MRWRWKLGKLPTAERRTELNVLPDDGKQRTATVVYKDVTSARRVKHDCKYPNAVPLMARYVRMASSMRSGTHSHVWAD